jgi:hypothetical protein
LTVDSLPRLPGARKRRRYREQEVQLAVIEHLRWRGQPNLFWAHIPNGGARTAIEGAVFKSLDVVAGAPDILIIHGGKCFGLELKSEHGRVTPTQTDCHQRMERAGAVVGVVRGVDEAIAWLEQHNLLRGRAQRSSAAGDNGWQRFREELAAAPTRDAATDVFHSHDFLSRHEQC